MLTRSELKAIRGRVVGDKKRRLAAQKHHPYDVIRRRTKCQEDREALYKDVIELSIRLQAQMAPMLPAHIREIACQPFEPLRLEEITG